MSSANIIVQASFVQVYLLQKVTDLMCILEIKSIFFITPL